MFKYRACNAVSIGALGCCRVHVSTSQRAAMKSAYLANNLYTNNRLGWNPPEIAMLALCLEGLLIIVKSASYYLDPNEQ